MLSFMRQFSSNAALLLFAIATSAGSSIAQLDSLDSELHDRAVMLIPVGRLDEAKDLFLQVVASDSTHVLALRNLGLIYYQTGLLDSAMITYQRAVALDSQNVELLIQLGRAYVDSGLVDDAIVLYRRAIELDSLDPAGYGELALAYGEKGDYDMAELMEKEAIRLSPYDPTSHNNMGSIYFQKEQWTDAIDHLILCRDISPWHPGLESKLHMFLDSVRTYFEDWIDREPSNPRSHYYLSYALCFRENPKKGVKEIEKAIKLDPEEPSYYRALGLFTDSQGKEKQARKAYERCLDLDSSCWDCAGPLSLLIAQKDPGEAMPLIEQTATQNPDVLQIQAVLGNCYSFLADEHSDSAQARELHQHAVAAYLDAVELLHGAPDANLYFNVAATYYRLRQFDEAKYYGAIAKYQGHERAWGLLQIISMETSQTE